MYRNTDEIFVRRFFGLLIGTIGTGLLGMGFKWVLGLLVLVF